MSNGMQMWLGKKRAREFIGPGDIAMASRRWAEAESAYRKALDVNPELAHIWVQYGHALKEQGKLRDADEAYERSLALDASLADTYLQLGHVRKLQGKFDDAVDSYLTAHRLAPDLSFPLIELRSLGLEMPAAVAVKPEFALNARSGKTADVTAKQPTAPTCNGQDALAGSASDRHSASDRELLTAHGLRADILDIFDFRYYFYANPIVQQHLAKPDPNRCLAHFCRYGVDAVLPFNEAYLFEADFYIETYLNWHVGANNAYWHWINIGFKKNWHPGRDNWLKEKIGCDIATFDGFDFEVCRAYFYGREKDAKWVDLITRFVDVDVFSSGPHFPVTENSAAFFTAIADRLAGEGKDDEAVSIYERVLLSVPYHRRALLNYADCLLRKRLFLQAKSIYAMVIGRNEHSIWCLLHQATCFEELSDLRQALACLQTGIERFPEEPRFRSRFEAVADQFITREWHAALAIGKLGRHREAQRRVQRACELISSMAAAKEQLPRKPIRSVAIVGNIAMPQCTFYRIEQKIEHLHSVGYEVVLYDFLSQWRAFLADIYKYDAVIFYRVPGTAPVIFTINRAKQLGLTTFYDIDDLIFAGDDYPGTFESFLGQITLEEYVGLKLCVPIYRHAISLCEYGIASTPELAREMAKLVTGGEAFVHRNGFGHKHQRVSAHPPAAHTRDQISIFYGSATKSHKDDFRDLVEPALVEIVKRHGNLVTIILVGDTVLSEALESIRPNLILLETTWDIEIYWSMLRQADINIAVLKHTPMTDCKSEIKWMEAAMFGIPSVVSGTVTYREVIEPGVTGLICDTLEEWVTALDLLVRAEALRRRIGLAAWHRVREAYNIPRMGENMASIFARAAPVAQPEVKPTIVIVNVFYPPQGFGGATRVVDDTVSYLSQAYHDDFQIEVFTSGWGTEKDYEVRCYLRDSIRVTSVLRPTVQEVEDAVVDETMEELFGEYLDRVNPALVHFHCIQRLTASVVSAALTRKIPYFITAHDGWWISDEQFIVNAAGESVLYDYSDPLATAARRGAPAYYRMTRLREPLFGASRILPVSDKFADLYRACGVPNVVSVANGITDLPEMKRTRSADGRVRLALIGGMVRAKGGHLIKYALLGRKFEHLRLTVIDGSLQPGSSRQEMWNTTPVEFLPKVPEDRVAELYAEIDVLLAPSVCLESFGLVTREALHCGCWVVASDRGSIGDCVTDGENGYVIDVSDASELIRILTLIDGAPQRYRGAPPSPPVFRHSSEQAAELAELYKSIIGSHGAIDGDAPNGGLDAVGAAVLDIGDFERQPGGNAHPPAGSA